jgi:DNA primase
VSLSVQFLDELRARTTLSALIAKTVKLTGRGAEKKGCCPFHNEKTPSFTVSDDKGFYHCFGCGAHGDAIRWMVDQQGLAFMDAIKQLAAAAGMDVPARSAEAVAREDTRVAASGVLDTAARWYSQQLAGELKVQEALEARGIGSSEIEKFDLGFAPPRKSVAGCGVAPDALAAAGVLIAEQSGLYRDRFRSRIMIPIHDARGRIVGFAGRLVDPPSHTNPGASTSSGPKYLNNPDSDHFDKGRLLFNLHRAAPAARSARRLIVVEGQFDTIALDQVGIAETVAPGGTALTEHQLERAWRVAHCPVLLFDGDVAGRKAALRAAERAMPFVGPGQSLAIATLPEAEDPDSIARSLGRDGVEALIAAAEPLSAWLWRALQDAAPLDSPEARASLWGRLAALAAQIRDPETKAQYLAEWRSRFDERFPPPPPGLTQQEMLPDGRVADLSGLEEGAQARLRSVAEAWLERTRQYAGTDPAKAGRWAWDVGRRVSAGLIDEEAAEDALAAAEKSMTFRVHPPPDLKDFRRSYDIGRRRGFDLGPLLTDMHCAGFERTDMGNAERWHARFGEDYLYTTAKGWLGWDGRRYRVLNQEKDTTPAEVLASVFQTVRAIQDEAHFVRATGVPEDWVYTDKQLDMLEEDPRRPGGMDHWLTGGKKVEQLSAKLAAWGRSSEASGRIGCIANLAKRWVTVELTEFDTDPMLLNCLNGTLRFVRADDDGPARVELKPHDRADRLTKVTACAYNPDAPAPLFQKTVRWAQPDRDRRRYLRQWLGYNLTGDMGEQIFHVWYGPLAANGKSTIGNECREAIGDYGDTTNVETFLDEGPRKHGDQATPAIVRLPGVRFLTAGEPPKGAKINEPLINSVTGGDPMLARDNFRSFFRFMPIFKFTMWCNDLPAIPQGTAGIWRRVKVMPWEQHLKPDERDMDLPKKLAQEHEGVLAWMVRGLIDWMEHGFVEPESVQLASADYKHDSDPLSSFLKLCTEPDPQGRVQSSHLYDTFCAWAKAAGETEWKQKGFSQALKAKGLASKASNGMHWLGLRMIKRPSDFIDPEGKVVQLIAEDGGGSDGPGSEVTPAPPDDDDDDLI